MEGGNSSRNSNVNPTMINTTPKPASSSSGCRTNATITSPNSNASPRRAVGLPPTSPSSKKKSSSSYYHEHDYYVPMANVIRIMRRILPQHAKIADDAKETVQESVSEFISFVTDAANEKCRQEQRRTVTADDIIDALRRLGFDDYAEPLSLYLERIRQLDPNRGLWKRPSSSGRIGLRGVGPSPSSHVGPMAGNGLGLRPAPAVMPPVPMDPHLGFFNDGSGIVFGPNSNLGSSSVGNYELRSNLRFNHAGGYNSRVNGFGMSDASTSATSSSSKAKETGFIDPFSLLK